MPIRPEEFYSAAQALNRLRPPLVSDEVCARTMANRMYYAAYLAVREAIRIQVGNQTFDARHIALVAALNHASDPDVRALGARLEALKAIRETADYRINQSISKFTAAVHLDHARFILDNAHKLMGRFPHIRRR